MARFGRNEQLVLVGAAVALLAYLIGIIAQGWSRDLAGLAIMIPAAVAIAVVVRGVARSVAGYPGATVVRIAAGLVGTFALIALGELVADYSQWEGLDVPLTILKIAGAAVLVYGAWGASGGNLLSDLAGIRGVMGLTMIDRLVYVGAAGVIVSWFLMMAVADIYNFVNQAQVVVLVSFLVLVVRWLDRNPSAGRLPLAAPWATAGLAAIAVLYGAWWFIRVIGRTLEEGTLIGDVILGLFVLALASLAAGGLLAIGAQRPAQPAA